jgi:hypothetical protein
VEDVLYENMVGETVSGIQLTLNYHAGTPPTNKTATPELRRITLRNMHIKADKSFLDCEGLSDSTIAGIVFDNVTITGSTKQTCSYCSIAATANSSPQPEKGCTAPLYH